MFAHFLSFCHNKSLSLLNKQLVTRILKILYFSMTFFPMTFSPVTLFPCTLLAAHCDLREKSQGKKKNLTLFPRTIFLKALYYLGLFYWGFYFLDFFPKTFFPETFFHRFEKLLEISEPELLNVNPNFWRSQLIVKKCTKVFSLISCYLYLLCLI